MHPIKDGEHISARVSLFSFLEFRSSGRVYFTSTPLEFESEYEQLFSFQMRQLPMVVVDGGNIAE